MSKLVDIYSQKHEEVHQTVHEIKKTDDEKVKEWFYNFCDEFVNDQKWTEKIESIKKEISRGRRSSTYDIERYYSSKNKSEYSLPDGMAYKEVLAIVKKNPFQQRIFKSGHILDECVLGLKVYYDIPNLALMMFPSAYTVAGFQLYIDYSNSYYFGKLTRRIYHAIFG